MRKSKFESIYAKFKLENKILRLCHYLSFQVGVEDLIPEHSDPDPQTNSELGSGKVMRIHIY